MSIVQLTSVRKSYGGFEVLKGVTLSVARGSVVVVIGRSGSGKSTMLRCINGLEKIQGGEITVNGKPVLPDEKALRALRRDIGFVFQSFNLFPHLTVERNITIGLTVVRGMALAEARTIAENALRQVGLLEKRDAYPDHLSGGQQQRVAIARCLALSPKVMLFDEVTSALDPELKGEVLKVIADLAQQGMTMILVTHEMQFARSVADHVVFMHEGLIWEEGPPATLFSQPGTPELKQFIATSL
ncbi:amino acid ABC transporter ATP-binding protein [Bosea sp. (in: a-proteobacteria)]|uniref:amino acid ABC transporter ATP-binding protein n=1 Tax=Bosea sp. (in: a-proteobacteria) TaxID=1871050 RepID=UPI002605ECB5|nr:amino acid ABC transporter ATP-binding protein [Bosea sp. (in: a-proteobacteria)]MCO5092920.1 amino acid ABC transporter ATP-binding protein [Bosea sp. (in: a-proteobacteria)]